MCTACYEKERYYLNLEKKREMNRRWQKKMTSLGRRRSACTILKQHHESMKDDPEHLTTDFLKKLIKVDCKM
jgi:hypothetical protein